MGKIYIAFEQWNESTYSVEYFLSPPNWRVRPLKSASRKLLGKRLIEFANSKKPYQYLKKIIPNDEFSFDSLEASRLQEDLKADLDLILKKGAGRIRQYLAQSSLLHRCVYEHELSVIPSKPAQPIEFSFYNDFLSTDKEFVYRRVYVVQDIQSLIAAEFFELVEAIENKTANIRPISKCAYCGKYFATKNRSDTDYCSRDCKNKAFAGRVNADEFYRVYKNKYCNVKRFLVSDDDVWKNAFISWRKRAKALLADTSQFSSPKEYLKIIGEDWKRTQSKIERGEAEGD